MTREQEMRLSNRLKEMAEEIFLEYLDTFKHNVQEGGSWYDNIRMLSAVADEMWELEEMSEVQPTLTDDIIHKALVVADFSVNEFKDAYDVL